MTVAVLLSFLFAVGKTSEKKKGGRVYRQLLLVPLQQSSTSDSQEESRWLCTFLGGSGSSLIAPSFHVGEGFYDCHTWPILSFCRKTTHYPVLAVHSRCRLVLKENWTCRTIWDIYVFIYVILLLFPLTWRST